ncbi:MAG TPA: lysophospholipid acyltransferase family protein [Bellilinea sp.]|nr:lysophospholipid acyltransferase family protein [Bellilinea sp.]
MILLALSLLCKIKVDGRENLPKTGPLLIVGNHFHFVDPVVMIGLMPDKLEFVGGTQMPDAPPFVRFIPKLYGLLPVRRGSLSRDTLTMAKQVLDQKGRLAMFPEAGSWLNLLRRARPGAAYLATTVNSKLCPVSILGVDSVFNLFKTGKRGLIEIKIGEPFGPYYVGEKGERDRTKLDEISLEIMTKISELLPDDRRGFLSSLETIRKKVEDSPYPWANEQEK